MCSAREAPGPRCSFSWRLGPQEGGAKPRGGARLDPTPAPRPSHSPALPLRPERLSWTAGKNRSCSLPAPPAWMEGGMDLGWRVAAPRPPRGRAGAVDGGEGVASERSPGQLPIGGSWRVANLAFLWASGGHSGPGCPPIPTAPRAAHPVLQPASPRPPPARRPASSVLCVPGRPYL